MSFRNFTRRGKRPDAHIGLLALLAFVVMFEGFDVNLTSVVLPYLGDSFDAPPDRLGRALSIIGLGAIVAWLPISLADRFGRRPVLLFAAGGFSIGSLLTALSTSLEMYTALQFVTRALLVTQIALAYLIVSETVSAQVRGRANGLLGAFGSFGAALPLILLAPATATEFGWRALFIVGAAPLLILPLLFSRLQETPPFLAGDVNRTASAGAGFLRLWKPGLRGRFLAMSGLWFIINFASAAATFFFSFYVLKERGWTEGDLALIAPFGLGAAFLGYIAAGWLMDLAGRRTAISAYLILIGALSVTCYTSADFFVIAACWVGLQTSFGAWTIAFTMNAELFPTDVRAAANGWCNNLLGRWGLVIAPALLGWLAVRFGTTGEAAAILGCAAFLGVPLVWLAIPETRAKELVAGAESSKFGSA